MSKTVIIAEDTDFLRETIQYALEDHDVQVIPVKNGQEAIDAIDKQEPDLMLLDLLMPQVDGYAVLEHINVKGCSFPIIVLTNMSDDANMDRCRQLGAREFLVKSDMDEATLWEKSRHYLGI
jgi:CheY-like chemotaxis protein